MRKQFVYSFINPLVYGRHNWMQRKCCGQRNSKNTQSHAVYSQPQQCDTCLNNINAIVCQQRDYIGILAIHSTVEWSEATHMSAWNIRNDCESCGFIMAGWIIFFSWMCLRVCVCVDVWFARARAHKTVQLGWAQWHSMNGSLFKPD